MFICQHVSSMFIQWSLVSQPVSPPVTLLVTRLKLVTLLLVHLPACLTCVHIVVSPLVTPLTLVTLLFVHLPACLIYVHTMVSPLVSRFFVRRPACHVQPRVSPVISCAGQCIRGTAGRWSGEPASVSAGCAWCGRSERYDGNHRLSGTWGLPEKPPRTPEELTDHQGHPVWLTDHHRRQRNRGTAVHIKRTKDLQGRAIGTTRKIGETQGKCSLNEGLSGMSEKLRDHQGRAVWGTTR